jgi:CRP-like cAMP-binding protein
MLRTETGRSDLSFQNSEFFTPLSDTRERSRFNKKAPVDAVELYDRNITETSNNVLSSLPLEVFESLAGAMKRVRLEKEEFLFQPDDEPDFIYFPETAAVSEFQILEDGRMVEVAIIGREGAIGLSKLFCSARIPNCVQVSQAGSAVRVNLADARKVIRQKPEIAFYFYPFVDAYIRQISQKTVCNLYHSVRARFCTWLLMVQDRCENPVLQLTHEQIARTLGVYRPRITCIARELKKKNVISYSRGGISICDRGAIEKSACDCYQEIRDCIDLISVPEAAATLH